MSSSDWLLDSGAFATMTPNKDIIKNYVNIQSFPVSLADGKEVAIVGTGQVHVRLPGGHCITVPVLHIPGLEMNLLSTFDINELGYDIVLKSEGFAQIVDDKKNVVSTIPLGPVKSFHINQNSKLPG